MPDLSVLVGRPGRAIINPMLEHSTYLGGAVTDEGMEITVEGPGLPVFIPVK